MASNTQWTRRAVAGVAGLIGAGAVVPVGAATAAPTPGTVASTAHSILRRVDVDGDGHRDSVRITWTSAKEGAQVSVRTHRGKRSSLRLSTSGVMEQGGDPWVGSAAVDGARGAELILLTDFGDIPHNSVYTWRHGRLSLLRAPGPEPANESWSLSPGYEGVGWQGYSFGTSRGVRTVTAWDLETHTRSGRWAGTATTYRWASSGWVEKSRVKRSVTTRVAESVCLWGGLRITR